MDMQKILSLADEMVFEKTGKHLDDLQVSILKGVWENQRYAKIAEEYRCTEGHVKDVSYELWQVLSEVFGEMVRKSNLKAVFERNQVGNFAAKDIVHIGNVHLCGEQQASEKSEPKTINLHKEGKNLAIQKLLELGLSAEQIAEILGLSVEEIKADFSF
ncbi:hypothetical protein [Tumidithrix elongata]